MTIPAVVAGALIDPVWGNAVADRINDIDTLSTVVDVAGSGPGGVSRLRAQKIGNMVHFEGYTNGFTGGFTTDCLFPVGYRPPAGVFAWGLANNGGTISSTYFSISSAGVITGSGTSWGYLAGCFQSA